MTATATKPAKNSKPKKPKQTAAIFAAAVEYGNVSVGDETARIGVKIARERCNLDTADECFCGRRLLGTIAVGDDDPDQMRFDFDDAEQTIDGTFDVAGYRVSPKHVTLGLTFALREIEVGDLAGFAKRAGFLRITEAVELPDAEDEDDEDDGVLPGTLKSDGPWRKYPIDDLQLAPSVAKALAKAGIKTVGDLADYTAADKRLTDLDGIGPGKAATIENRMLDFWKDNPDAEGK